MFVGPAPSTACVGLDGRRRVGHEGVELIEEEVRCRRSHVTAALNGRRLWRSSKKVVRNRRRCSGIGAELVRELPGVVFDSFAEVWFDVGPVADDAGIDRVGALLWRHLVHLRGGDDSARFGHDAEGTAAARGLGVMSGCVRQP